MNKVFLIGRLTQDPTAQSVASDHTVCRFSIAVNRYSRGGESTADFINIVTWDGLAQNCAKYLKKGSQVAVMGSIQTGSYERDGVKRYTTDVRADQVEFLSRAGAGGDSQSASNSGNSYNQEVDTLKEVDDDDMPF